MIFLLRKSSIKILNYYWLQSLSDRNHANPRQTLFSACTGVDSPCTKPIWDSSENSSQAKPFITNQPYPSPVRLQPYHRVHSISYLRQQMRRCIPFPIPGNRCRISSLYNYAVSPVLDRTSSTINFFLWITLHFR